MKNSHLVWIALVGMGLFTLALSSPANADKNDGKETCANNVGALTSCEICEESPRGPKLHRVVWRYHKKF